VLCAIRGWQRCLSFVVILLCSARRHQTSDFRRVQTAKIVIYASGVLCTSMRPFTQSVGYKAVVCKQAPLESSRLSLEDAFAAASRTGPLVMDLRTMQALFVRLSFAFCAIFVCIRTFVCVYVCVRAC
jgi:hypothetical protein